MGIFSRLFGKGETGVSDQPGVVQPLNGLSYAPDQSSVGAEPAPPATKEQLLEDIVWSIGTMYSGLHFPKYNPDDLQGRKGYLIYKKMMVDEQIKAVVRFKRDAITSRKYSFTSEYEDLSDEENAQRVKIMEESLVRMEGSFSDAINNIMSAMYMGFSMTEKVLQLNKIDGKQWYGVKHLRLKPGDTFYFYLDEFGNVIKLTQRMYGIEQALDPGKFIHYVQNPEWDLQYGRSELRECYRAYFSKDMIIKFQNIYLERFAGGFAWAQPQNGKNLIPGTKEYSDLQSVLQNINTLTSAIIPQNVGLNIEHPATTNAFELAIAQADKAIAKALLVPNLLGISEQGTHGSLAQADSQLEAFLWTLQADTARLEDCLQEQLFDMIGDLNWGDKKYPQFKFEPISDKNKMLLINTWAALVTAGAVEASDTDEETLRDLLSMPDKGEPIQTKSAPPVMDPKTGLPVPQAPQPKIPTPKVPEPPLPGRGGKNAADETVMGERLMQITAFMREKFGYNPDQPRAPNGQWDGGAYNATDALVHHSGSLSNKIMQGEGSDQIAKEHAAAIREAMKNLPGIHDPNMQPEIRQLHISAGQLAAHVENGTAHTDSAAQQAIITGAHAGDVARNRAMTMFERFAYSPDQARDNHGMWTVVGGGDVNTFAYHGTSDNMIAGKDALPPGQDMHSSEQAAAGHAHAAALMHSGNPVIVRVDASKVSTTNPVPIHSVKKIPMLASYKARHGKPLLVSQAAFAKAEKRVDFAVIDKQSEAYIKDATDNVAGVLSGAVKRIVGAIKDTTLADVPAIKFTPDEMGKLKTAVLGGLKNAYALGASHAKKEVAKASMSRKFDSVQSDAADFLAAKAFTITGSLSGQTTQIVQNILVDGIRNGRSAADMTKAIYSALESAGLTTEEDVQNALGTVSAADTAARIATVIRTASFDAINEARYDFFSDPAMDGFVQALEYSAILDNVTTEICQDLDGDTWAVNDPLWDTYTPPNHYNCRSIVIPVTIDDTWEPSPKPDVLPQKGFGF